MITAIVFSSSIAMADGFRCLTMDGDLKINVFNSTDLEVGTRTGAVMIVSDPTVQNGRKSIATFKNSDGLLQSEGTHYEAKVDLRYKNSNRKGENIAGTKLGALSEIHLFINHNYSRPINDGEVTTADLVLLKRSGDTILKQMVCSRYLKN